MSAAADGLTRWDNDAGKTGYVQIALNPVELPPHKRRWLYVMTTLGAIDFGLPDRAILAAYDRDAADGEGRCYFLTNIKGDAKSIKRPEALRLLGKAAVRDE